MTSFKDYVSTRDIAVAIGLGALAGVRATLPNALLGRASTRSGRGGKAGWLGAGLGARVMTFAGLLELVGDKLPGAPDRVTSSPQLARIGSGGLAAAALGRPRLGSMALLALVGGATAALSTTLSFRLRRRAIRRWGLSGGSSGLIEDAIVLAAAAALLPQLRRRSEHDGLAPLTNPIALLKDATALSK